MKGFIYHLFLLTKSLVSLLFYNTEHIEKHHNIIFKMESEFSKKTVKELQHFLRQRGVTVSNLKKSELIDKCINARDINIAVAPDGLLENEHEKTKKKLVTLDDKLLKIPTSCDSSSDISILPSVTLYDLFGYLEKCDTIDDQTLRDYDKMEGFQMARDGFVLDIRAGGFEDHSDYCFVTSKVKPRTKDKDPITKLDHYKVWIIFSKDEKRKTSIFFSRMQMQRGK